MHGITAMPVHGWVPEAIGESLPGGGVGQGFHDDGGRACVVAAMEFCVEGAGEGLGVVGNDGDAVGAGAGGYATVGDDMDGVEAGETNMPAFMSRYCRALAAHTDDLVVDD